MNLDSVTIIIRSVGERTESLCKKLILDQGVPEEAVFVINEAPFSKALKTGLEIGLAEKRTWTFCVDADVLLRPQSISSMVQHAEEQSANVSGIQGYVLDRFFGGARMAGNHIYRTSLLGKVIEMIPPEGTDIRPETYALRCMHADGHPWRIVNELVGLHDFEQSFEDIFRKCFVQAHKHLNHAELFVQFWRSKSSQDMDYRLALDGFAEGIKHSGEVRVDKKAAYFSDSMKNSNFEPKREIDVKVWDLQEVESIINNWVEPVEYWRKYPGGMRAASGPGICSRTIAQYKWQRERSSVTTSAKQVLAWLLIGAGGKLESKS